MKPLMPETRVRDPILDNHRQSINMFNVTDVQGLRLENTWHRDHGLVAIIQGPSMSRARKSAENIELPVKEFQSFNFLDQLTTTDTRGIEIRNIVIPHAYRDQDMEWVNHVRIMNHRLEYPEVARVLTHMTIWNHCVVTGTPLIILEHDAVLDSSPGEHLPRNSVIGLDTKGTLTQVNTNYRVMPGVWAYAVDQFSSKRLFNHILSQGIREPLDLLFRADQRLIVLKDHAHRYA